MKLHHAFAFALITASLAGCAFTPQPLAPKEVVLSRAGTPVAKNYTITGSHIPSTKTDKLVSQVTQQEYREAMMNLPCSGKGCGQ